MMGHEDQLSKLCFCQATVPFSPSPHLLRVIAGDESDHHGRLVDPGVQPGPEWTEVQVTAILEIYENDISQRPDKPLFELLDPISVLAGIA
jgi:hypothetical protein